MRRAFTLLELLVVVAIMAILGTVSIGGYRAMQRGIEERGVMQVVNHFIRNAYQRAQIDRVPVAVYYWNEMLRGEDEYGLEPPVVVGRAVAIRRVGRLTMVDGQRLGDEFGDLRYNNPNAVTSEDYEKERRQSSGVDSGNGVYLYSMNLRDLKSGFDASRVMVDAETGIQVLPERLLSGGQGDIECCYYQKVSGGGGSWSPKVGDAYGMVFAEIELPHNYLFGKDVPKSINRPVSGENVVFYRVGENRGSGVSGGVEGGTITVSSLRQGSGGTLTPETVDTVDRPDQEMKR